MDLYAQNIMDHFKNPRNRGRLSDADVTHAEANYSCGDKLSIDLKIENNTVNAFAFAGAGCAISQASVSMLGELVKGKTETEILAMTFQDLQQQLGIDVSERRTKCALLGLLTVQNAILQKQNKEPKKWSDYVAS